MADYAPLIRPTGSFRTTLSLLRRVSSPTSECHRIASPPITRTNYLISLAAAPNLVKSGATKGSDDAWAGHVHGTQN